MSELPLLFLTPGSIMIVGSIIALIAVLNETSDVYYRIF